MGIVRTVGILTLLLSLASSPARAVPILETATLGPTGLAGGVMVSEGQWLGARFLLDRPTRITKLGGHLFSLSGDFFAAVVALSDLTSVPATFDLQTRSEFFRLFSPPSSSDMLAFATDFILPAGVHGLVFGAQPAWGATGDGGMPGESEGQTDIGSPSYFRAVSPTGALEWQDGGLAGVRFVAEGTSVVPEPGTLLLLGSGLLGLAGLRRSKQSVGRS